MNGNAGFWQRFDYILLGATLFLIMFGILEIRSATYGAIDPDIISRVPDQILYAVIGLFLVFALAAVDYRLLGGIHLWLYLLMVGLLILVLVLGSIGDAGARRWINLGIRVQPSEIGKIIVIITLGTYLAKRYERIDRIPVLLGSIVHLGIPAGLVLLQPDLGTTIVFGVIWAALVWSAGLRLKHIGMVLLVLVIAVPIAWPRMPDYMQSRITTFISPASDPDAFYNINQALISIGSGGVFGKGYSAPDTQNRLRFLRVRHTDFIFSVISEEFGMVGGIAVMSIIGLVIMRVLRGARLALDPLGSMICYGVAAMIFFQTTVSIGMNLNLLPVTGLTLPFVSSGGTSLLSMLAGIGLAQSVIIRRRRV